MLRRAAIVLLAGLPLVAVAPAQAANVVARDGTVLRAQATDQIQLSVARSGATITFGSNISFTESEATCSKPDAFTVTCTPASEITRIDLVTGSGGDFLNVGALDIPLVWLAGDGNDLSHILGSGGVTAGAELHGQGGSDFLRGNVGPDLIDGGPGNDRLDFGNGDELVGGPDSDSLDNISAFRCEKHQRMSHAASDCS